MKITFFSNFLNHHQIPFCLALISNPDIDFTFVACENVPDERIQLGYLNEFSQYPFLLEAFKSEANYKVALELGLNSDLVIIGSADEIFIEERLKENKLIFRYSERLFKSNKHVFLYPYLFLKRFKTDTVNRNKNIYMLSSSAYTPVDYKMFLSYPNKFFKWGYFPKFIKYDKTQALSMKPKNHIQILWVGRFLNWKRPFMAIKVVENLISKGYNVKLNMIGTGILYDEVLSYIKNKKLESNIFLLGSVDAKDIRSHMLLANIFLSTSTKQEGWGAVVNEAMNSFCAVYAYYRVGSAPYLIEHNVSGKMFLNIDHLVKHIIHDIETNNLEYLGSNAYHTIMTKWNEDNAVKELYNVIKSILNNKSLELPENGPLSKAPYIYAHQVKQHIKKIDKQIFSK